MKQVLMLLAALLATAAVHADQRSDAVLRAMTAKLKACAGYRIDFTATAGDEMPATGGYYMVSGEGFYISVDPVEVYGDGKVRYEVNGGNREVVIDRIDPADRNILSNPARALDFLDGGYSHSYVGEEMYHGRKCRAVKLVLVSAAPSGFSDVTLYVSSDDRPAGVVYTVEGMGEPVDVRVDSFAQAPDGRMPAFDNAQYKGYEIVDFR